VPPSKNVSVRRSVTYKKRMWFRFRLAWMAGVFGAAIGLAMAFSTIETRSTLVLTTTELWGAQGMFAATGMVCIAAFALRVWSEALLAGVVYGQQASTHVVAAGPFSVTRNPLYLGTWCFFVASVGPYLPPLVWLALAVLFLLVLRAIVVDEEAAMQQAVGAPFAAYCASVPRFLGRVGSFPQTAVAPTSSAWLWGVASNIFLLTLGLYRIVVATMGASRVLGLINVAALVVWLVVVLARRARA
jgi:protein-S-isoprenylcysteine O-methyltransferase Ste14